MNALDYITAHGEDIETIYRAPGTYTTKHTISAGWIDRIHFYLGGEVWILYDEVKKTIKGAIYGADHKLIRELAI